ncbi:MAG: C40 family peptidase, partial [Pseudobutyrivibrio sp.]|nr:C40 family peptidase [Pseudobutyrivibrio sp.]
RVERDYPGYDEYQYDIAEIGHDPYQLASYLTAVIEDYTPSEAACYVENLFNNQYRLTLTPVTETRYRPIYDEYGEYVGEEPYDYHILRVGLTNRGIDAVVRSMGLYNTELERYEILLQTKGNKSYLFEDSIYANVAEYLEYDIPGEALTDQAFANMIAEAEKYLGMSYVWGGSDPSTGFDCSGFVSYVINNSGNGWNVGRKTANGLKNSCDIIRSEEAKPGDLIFFKGTYGVSGASHVGIYVGNNMMIHCGNPISYAHTDTAYWQEHFYCFGRLP